MKSSAEHIRARDEVFRRIGRNVLLFQQIELMLKTLLNKGQFKGTLSELKQLVGQRATSTDKRTFGQLIDPAIDRHFTPFDEDAVTFAGTNEISVAFHFAVEHTAEQRETLRVELESLVAERNELIHHSLSRFHLDSIAGCLSASAELERQQERIEPLSNKLREIICTMVDFNTTIMNELPAILRGKPEGGAALSRAQTGR